MRYFIATKEGVVTRKDAVSGSDEKTESILESIREANPELVITEVDEATFSATQMPVIQTKEQKDWADFKAKSPTTEQSIDYLAKAMGLE